MLLMVLFYILCVHTVMLIDIIVPDVSSASSSTNSTEDLDALDVMRKQKQFKLVIETGKQKFNVSPKKVCHIFFFFYFSRYILLIFQ